MTRIYLFKRFERFWHWTQAVLVLFMLLSGFEAHGTYKLLGWQKAVDLHVTAAWCLVTLWVFAIFWHFTTGEWRQYIPTGKNVVAVARYYLFGMFSGEEHPHRVTQLAKHNPLQRLAYLMVKLVINPLVWISGFAYLYYPDLERAGATLGLRPIALAHTLAAFLMLLFVIAHVYTATIGHSPLAKIKSMITGWDEEPEHA